MKGKHKAGLLVDVFSFFVLIMHMYEFLCMYILHFTGIIMLYVIK